MKAKFICKRCDYELGEDVGNTLFEFYYEQDLEEVHTLMKEHLEVAHRMDYEDYCDRYTEDFRIEIIED